MWCGAAVAVAIFLPNLIWQAQHHFIYLDFIRHIHARDVAQGRADGFLSGQLTLTLLAFPIAIAGLLYYWVSPGDKRYRPLVWMYMVPLLLFVIAKGRDYYLAGAYPMLYAAGAVQFESWFRSRTRRAAAFWRSLFWVALVADAGIAGALMLPLAPINSSWFHVSNQINGDLREEIGWPELVQTVVRIRDGLSVEDRAHVAILAANYGEAGAIDLYGPAYGLPHAISGVNSFWERGYGDPPPTVLIVIGLSRAFVTRNFEACEVAARTWNQFGVANEETAHHPEIFVCRGLRQSWPEFWKQFRYYG
jgi:hypothetical protein